MCGAAQQKVNNDALWTSYDTEKNKGTHMFKSSIPSFLWTMLLSHEYWFIMHNCGYWLQSRCSVFKRILWGLNVNKMTEMKKPDYICMWVHIKLQKQRVMNVSQTKITHLTFSCQLKQSATNVLPEPGCHMHRIVTYDVHNVEIHATLLCYVVNVTNEPNIWHIIWRQNFSIFP